MSSIVGGIARIPTVERKPQCADLPSGCLGELGAAVADLHHEQPGQHVEVGLTAVIEDGHTLTTSDDRQLDTNAVLGEMRPEIVSHVIREPNARLAI